MRNKINGIVIKAEDRIHLFNLDDEYKMVDPSMPISEGVYKDMRETQVYFVNSKIVNENKDEIKFSLKDFFSVTLLKNKDGKEEEVSAKELMHDDKLSKIVSGAIEGYLEENKK